MGAASICAADIGVTGVSNTVQVPIDRRTVFGGLAGAALAAGVSGEGWGRVPGPLQGEQATRWDSGDLVQAKLRERPSVRDKGAKGDGVSMDGAAIQDALRSFDTIWVPPGVYLIDVPLTLPSYCVLAFSSNAIFCPAHDGMTIFQTGEVSYASRILAPRVHARGKRDVTAFDLQGFRHRAEIQHADILECTRGIVLRELCWDTLIYMPWIRQTTNPVIIANGSNAVDVIHPGIDDFDVGIQIDTGPRQTTTSTRIWGGYLQNGRCGIVDNGSLGTVVDGTYFEGLRDGDIILSHAVRSNLSRTQHYGDKGRAAIRMIEADGATIFDPVMSNGSRTIGLYDIDDLSRNITRFEGTTSAGVNQPVGNTGRSGNLVREEGGAFKPVLASVGGASTTYPRQEGRWCRSGRQLSVAVELCWSNVRPGGEMVISGVPALARLPSKPLAALAPAVVQGGEEGPVHARLEQNGDLRIVTVRDGKEVPLMIGASGGVSTSITCLF